MQQIKLRKLYKSLEVCSLGTRVLNFLVKSRLVSEWQNFAYNVTELIILFVRRGSCILPNKTKVT